MSEERNGRAFQLPVGYRFDPTKEELLNYYLHGLFRGQLPHQPCVIPVIDIYNYHPKDLPRIFYGKSVIPPDDQLLTWWFFSPYAPDRAGKVKRSTRYGYWKKTGDDKKVRAKDTATEIGYKKILVFHEGRGMNGNKTNWVIHEYHLPENDALGGTHVLCRLKLKRDKQNDNSSERSNLRAFMRRLFERKLRQRG